MKKPLISSINWSQKRCVCGRSTKQPFSLVLNGKTGDIIQTYTRLRLRDDIVEARDKNEKHWSKVTSLLTDKNTIEATDAEVVVNGTVLHRVKKPTVSDLHVA